jgi:hypothetical protein
MAFAHESGELGRARLFFVKTRKPVGKNEIRNGLISHIGQP